MLDTLNSKRSILHIVLSIGATNTTYNEHCLPVADKRDLAICTYFPSDVVPPESISLFEGNGTLKGFFRVLRAALSARSYDAIHTHSPHVSVMLLAALLFGHRSLLSSTVVTVHDSYSNLKKRNQLLFIPVFASFRKIICCSQASYASFPAFYKWLAGDRLGFVQNGVDIDRIDHIATTSIRGEWENRHFTVVAVSRLVDIKNPSCAISAFGMGRDETCRFTYIGDGPLRIPLRAEIRATDLENKVDFTGLLPRDKVFEHLLNADLFISTSLGEGLPVSVLEAMACRCPVILSDIPPHREIATGIDFIPLIDPEDVEGFAREIRKYRQMQADERATIGQQCRRLVEERFSLDAMHVGYEQVYSEISPGQRPVVLQELAR